MDKVPYAPPIPRLFTSSGVAPVEAQHLRPGDWVDSAPWYGRIEDVRSGSDGLLELLIAEAGTTELTRLEHVGPTTCWPVVPDPGPHPHEVSHLYRHTRP